METFELFTRDGVFLVSIRVPKFTPRAEVIFWDGRVFVYDKTAGVANAGAYVEGLGFQVPAYMTDSKRLASGAFGLKK